MMIKPELLSSFEWWMLGVSIILILLFLHIFNRTPRIKDTPKTFRVCLAVLFSWGVLYGGSKPPPTPPAPTIKGITLNKVKLDTRNAMISWQRDDGSNSVGKVYAIQRKRPGDTYWTVALVVRDADSAMVEGWWIVDDMQWRILDVTEEVGNE